MAMEKARPDWLKSVPEGMAALVFYGSQLIGLPPEIIPNGKTVVFILPVRWVINASPTIWVGTSVTSRKDQFSRKRGRTIALGRALCPDRADTENPTRHRRQAYLLEAVGNLGGRNSAFYRADGALDEKVAANVLRSWAVLKGWL
jgi:hypothetical protein